MPKETQSAFNFRMVREYPKLFCADNNVLYCLICEQKAPASKLFTVKQHLRTGKHVSLMKKKQDPNGTTSQTLMTNFQKPQPQVNMFHMDLCKTLMEANIPLHKISNKGLIDFLEKYTNRTVPSESTLRNKYVSTLYDETISNLRAKVANKRIWVSVDETTDSEQRLVGNFVFGLMEGIEEDSDERGKCYLLNVGILPSSDANSISVFFMDSLSLLWPEGKAMIGKKSKMALILKIESEYFIAAFIYQFDRNQI